MKSTLLSVSNLKVSFQYDKRIIHAVDSLSFDVSSKESIAIVGESGSGKSVSAMSIMKLLLGNHVKIQGEVMWQGDNLLEKDNRQLENIRGNDISMIFQEPMSALNPLYTIGKQISEPLIKHKGLTNREALEKSKELLEQMGMNQAEIILSSYPHQLSGGMRQRAMIAMAMACEPKLIIADEPTTALDVTIQAQILSLIQKLQQQTETSLILITHNLGIVAQISKKVIVMYAGEIVEMATTENIINNPQHPYTKKLIQCIPKITSRGYKLPSIKGNVESLNDLIDSGCRFVSRCDSAKSICHKIHPSLINKPSNSNSCKTNYTTSIDTDTRVRCLIYDPQYADLFQKTTDTFIEKIPSILHSENNSKREKNVLIDIDKLNTWFPVKTGFFSRVSSYIKAVNNISLSIKKGVSLALVGESGCGKSTLGLSILRLIPSYAKGNVIYMGLSDTDNILNTNKNNILKLRNDLQVIFQDPYSSLNPRMNIAQILMEGLLVHENSLSKEEKYKKIENIITDVGLSKNILNRFPHEFSGGQRQRISIARALVISPKFIVLDEATSALDVSVQAQVLNLLTDLKLKYDLTYLFITHDIGVVSYIADEIAVMYLGNIVEFGVAEEILKNPKHPYTQLLLSSIPSIETKKHFTQSSSLKYEEQKNQYTTSGINNEDLGKIASLNSTDSMCSFMPRCLLKKQLSNDKQNLCEKTYPSRIYLDSNRWLRCHAYKEQGKSAL